jgi:hypothetical protein
MLDAWSRSFTRALLQIKNYKLTAQSFARFDLTHLWRGKFQCGERAARIKGPPQAWITQATSEAIRSLRSDKNI